MNRRVLTLFLALCMMISLLPSWAMAEDADIPADVQAVLGENEIPLPGEEDLTEILPDEDTPPESSPTGTVEDAEPSLAEARESATSEESVSDVPDENPGTEATPLEEPSASQPQETRVSDPSDELQAVEELPAENLSTEPAESPVTEETVPEEPAEAPSPEEPVSAEPEEPQAGETLLPEEPADPTDSAAAAPAEPEEELITEEAAAENVAAKETPGVAEVKAADDSAALTVSGITLSANSVAAGGSLTVTVKTNASRVSSISFRNAAADETISVLIMREASAGVFTGTVEVSDSRPAGTYVVDTVSLGTLLNPTPFYGEGNQNYSSSGSKLSAPLAGVSFTVTASENKDKDTKAPTVKGISLSASDITAPGSVTVTVKTSEDISGISSISFRNAASNKTLRGTLTKTAGGTASATIEADSATEAGKYIVDTVYLLDEAGNSGTYVGQGNAGYTSSANKLPDSLAATAITVSQPGSTPVFSSVGNTTRGVKLSWTGTGSTYEVLRKAQGESSYSKVSDTSESTYTDTSVVSGTKYSYKVRARNAAGKAIGTSKARSVTFLAAPKVSSVSVTSAAISIKWKKVQGAEAYRVLRKTDGGKWETLADTTALTWTDKTAAIGSTYTYTVRCVSADGSRNTSAYTSGKTLNYLASPVLSSVTNVKTGVKLKWARVAGAEQYRVFRRIKGGKWTKLTDTTSVTYTDKTTESGTRYWYAVRCMTADGRSCTSSLSASKSRTFVEATVLSMPVVAEGAVTLKWAKVTGAEKYRVFRKTSDGSWQKLKDTAAIKFVDKTAVAGTKYSYAVRCINADGSKYTSALSTAKTVTAK